MNFVEVIVNSRTNQFKFIVEIHQSKTPENFHLDPVEFYQKHGGEIPPTPHHEIQIIHPGKDFFGKRLFHIHASRKDPEVRMICYPRAMPTMEDAVRVFHTWCLGTVLTIVEDIDLNTILKECNDDHARMEQVVKDHYGIAIATDF